MLFNLNTTTNGTNVLEDARNAMSAANAPVSATASIVLPENLKRTNYMIYNSGPSPVYLREGTAPVASGAPAYNVIIPSGFLWKEDMENARFTGPIHAVCAAGATATLQVSEGTLP